MFDQVIVGINGQGGGRDALALAKILLGVGGRLTLVNVYPSEAYVWLGGNPAYPLFEEEESSKLLERTRQETGVEADLKQIGDRSVGKGLHELAEDVGADLLVVGSSHRGLMGRVTLNHDTRAALNGAPCAVAIAPTGYAGESRGMREIGVAYNGSKESEHALAIARELAARYGAKLSAFEAVTVPIYAVVHGTTAPDGSPIEDLVDKARERIAALAGVEAHAAYGEAEQELALFSASLDLLVVGSRDYGPLGRLVHGSTTHRLARSARCPLLALTRAARKTESAAPTADWRTAPRVVGPM